jgi:hypothetical protein
VVLKDLGIDPNNESEVYECGLVEDGCHIYCGWFYLVGKIVAAGEQNFSAIPSTRQRPRIRGHGEMKPVGVKINLIY